MKRIYMLSSQMMFSRGVETLLQGRVGLEIVGRETDPTKAITQIRELKPDVIFLDSKDLASAPATIIASILREVPCAKIIALNLENDQIRIYRGEQRIAQSADDLLEVIDEEDAELSPITTREWATLASRRAQIYGFLAEMYNRSIDENLLENLKASSMQLIGSLEQGEDLTGDLRQGVRALERFQQELSSRPREALMGDLEEEYIRLLQGDQVGDRNIHACEAGYMSGEAQQIKILITELNCTYFGGLGLPAKPLARPDFIGCELDFMQSLCSKESNDWMKNDRKEALRVQKLEREFLRDHVIRWVPRFCDIFLRQAKLDFYRGIACLTKGFILNEAYRVAELMEWISMVGDVDEAE